MTVLFPTHLLAAAMLGRSRPLSTPWLLAGAAIPDLLDKPLAAAGVVDLFHSVGHSVFVFALLIPFAARTASGRALTVGWGSHFLLDAVHVLLNGRPDSLLSLGWPVVAPEDPFGLPPVAFATQYVGTPSFFFECLLWLLAASVAARALCAPDGLHRP